MPQPQGRALPPQSSPQVPLPVLPQAGRTLTAATTIPGTVCNLSEQLDRLCRDACQTVPEFAHLDPDRILFTLGRSRAGGRHGLYGRIIPLRFADGEQVLERRRGGYRETWRLPPLEYQGRDIRYVIQIMVPRFLRLTRREKLGTVFHELFHIGQHCAGDLRRFPGRNHAHGASRRKFQQQVEALLTRYLAAQPDPALLAPYDLEEADWLGGRLRLTGLQVPLPRARLVARVRLP